MKKNYFLRRSFVLTLMLVSVLAFSQPVDKTIIFVGQLDGDVIRPEDQTAMDSIAQWVNVVFMHQNTFNEASADTLYGDAPNMGAEGIIVSESIGSTGVGNFGLRDGYPVPAIIMEGVLTNDPASTEKWPLLLETGGVWGYGTPTDVDVQWVIAEDQHYITEGTTIGQTINYANAADRGVPYLHGVSPSHIILAHAARTDGGDQAGFTQEEAIGLGYIVAPPILYMNVAYTYLGEGAATPEFYNILHRSVEFVFDAVPPEGIDQLTADAIGLSVMPNPAIDDATIRFNLEAGKNISVNLISVVGGFVGTVYSGVSVAGENAVRINTSDLVPGLYFVELKIENASTYSRLIHQ